MTVITTKNLPKKDKIYCAWYIAINDGCNCEFCDAMDDLIFEINSKDFLFLKKTMLAMVVQHFVHANQKKEVNGFIL